MNFDFPAFLVFACLITGGIWLADAVLFAPRRRQLAQASVADGAQVEAEEVAGGYKEPIIVEYSRSFFPVILIVLLLRSFLVEPFRIPSGSMMPTLLVGDFILVNKYAYGLRWPVLDKKFVEIGEPQRGDVVVFRFPQKPSIDYIKRVVGVPGDEIGYRNKTLYVNGEPAPQTSLGIYRGVGSGAGHTGALVMVEDLTGVKHEILVRPTAPDLPPGCRELSYGPVTVPDDRYFVMGDNRDASNDSRCWGFVPEENLVGRAFAIWLNWDWNSDWLAFNWGRFGNRIE